MVVMEAEDVKLKIYYNKQALVVYCKPPLKMDVFLEKMREACKIPPTQPITAKWIDPEDDPCTISCQVELDEALRIYRECHDAELKVHVFIGMPINPGAPCQGEDRSVYRRGARIWKKKFYHVNGHRFQAKRLRAECSICHDDIWGLGRQGMRCVDCQMCVHKKCHRLVRKPCTTESLTPLYPTNIPPASQTMSVIPDYSKDYSNGDHRNENEIASQGRRDSFASGDPSWKVSIDDFNLLTIIGRGSYAKVVQAEHKQTKQIYAIKIIKKEMFTDDEEIDWVQTEKSVFETATNHPFLVGLHSCFQTDSRLFFVIEFIPGGDLMYHMQRQRKLPEDHARFYSAEIILALHFLHSKSIIYRDLKLDNVLIDADGHIKLTDYGMCKENIGPGVTTQTFCGTPNYIAPEILRGESYGFSVDWWALGVLMYEMMAGRSPFNITAAEENDQNTEDILFQHILEKPIRIPRTLSVKAASVLKAFMNKDPKERLGCKDDLDEALEDMKNNSFFKGLIDWELLSMKQVMPPYNPNVESDRDLQHFDRQFTEELPQLTPDDPVVIERIDQSEFEGFEYINPLMMSKEDNVFYRFMYGVGIICFIYFYLFLIYPNWFNCIVKLLHDKRWIKDYERLILTETSYIGEGCGSFYLRIGTLFLGSIGIVLFGLEIFTFTLEAERDFHDTTNLAFAITFTIIQMHFLFSNSNIKISRTKNIAKIGIMHLMAVNIWTWFRFILIKYTFKNNKKYSYSHLTVEEILSDQNYTSTKSSGELLTYEYFGNITTLFVTCIVEYSVIGAAVMFVMWKTIDQESHHENQIIYQEPHHENQSIVKKRTVFNVDFSSSFEGLFIGVLFMTSSFVSIGIYLYFYQNDPQAATLTYRISDCILLSFALVGCIIGLYRIRLLQYGHLHQSKSEVVDEILLFVGFLGELIHCIASFFCWSVTQDETQRKMETYMIFILGVRGSQIISQTFFISLISKLRCQSQESIKQKPGKQVVTFIMIANISLFIFHNLEEMNSVLGDAMENKQAKPYVVLTSIMSPFVIFYRFHSSVCLAEIWKICYNIRVNYKGKNENTACNIERRDRDTNGSTATISTVFMKV